MEGILAAGRASLQAGNIDAAIRAAKQVLMDDPQSIPAMELLCSAHMAERDYMSAQDVISAWLRIMPDDPDAHWKQIMLQMTLGRQDDAKARIDQFEKSFPNSLYHTIMLRGIWEDNFGSAKKAKEFYHEILALEPDNADMKSRIAMVEVEDWNIIAASELMLEVLQENAGDADALRTLAVAELKAFRLSSAREFATAAQAANPRDLAMKKVKWLSWLVLFPPFAIGHVLQILISQVRFHAGGIAAHILCAMIAAAMVAPVIWSSEMTRDGAEIPLQTSLILTTVFLAGCWTLSMYYIFGIGNADEDKRTATLSGGY